MRHPMKIRSPKLPSVLIENKMSVGQIVNMAGCSVSSSARVPIKMRWVVGLTRKEVLKQREARHEDRFVILGVINLSLDAILGNDA